MRKFKPFVIMCLVMCLTALLAFAAMAEENVNLEAPTGVRWDDSKGLNALFDEVDGASGIYEVEVFRNGSFAMRIKNVGNPMSEGRVAVWSRWSQKNSSGSYTFRVRVLDDDGMPISGWSEYSDVYEYTKPEVSFGKVQNLQWSESEPGIVSWDIPDNLKNVPEEDRNCLRYFVRIYNGEGEQIFGIYNVTESTVDFTQWINVDEDYVFSVQAQSRYIERVASGEEVKSEPFVSVGEIVENVKSDLDDILFNFGSEDDEEVASPSDALQDVKKLNLKEMAVAVQTDEHVLQTLSDIEDIYLEKSGKSVELEVSGDTELTLDDVEIYGAGLNIASASDAIKVEMKKPDKDVEVDSLVYANAVQMDISLKDAEKPLRAPITIIMKIPDTINSEYLRILHYHGNSPEIIWPVITSDGRAKFTVTEFSRFVFVERNVIELEEDEEPEQEEDPGQNDTNSSGSHSGSSGGGGGSSRGSSSSGTITTDAVKGQISSVSGIITGSGDGYSKWISEAAGLNAAETKWKLQYADGTFAAGSYLTDEQGNPLKDSAGNAVEQPLWELINGAWFAFGVDSYVKTGLVFDPSLNGWFYIDVNTGMKTGWQQIGGIWYYFNTVSDGRKGMMFVNQETPDGYRVMEDGSWNGEANNEK